MDTAWIGAGGVLVGGVATALLGMVGEARRAKRESAEHQRQRAHELGLRELELRAQHRASLHAERRAAYAAFNRCYPSYDNARRALQRAQAHEAADPDLLRETLDSLVGISEAIDDALMLVELIASRPVAAAAHDLRDLIANERIGGERHNGPFSYEEEAAAEVEFDIRFLAAEQVLREAIRAELELDQ